MPKLNRELIFEVLNSYKKPDKFWQIFEAARNLRFVYFNNTVETCAILNSKSGRCPSDCKFCAQSAKFSTSIKIYPLLPKEKLIDSALKAYKVGIDRFSFVTSGVSPTKEEVKLIGEAIEKLKGQLPSAKVCASLGQLSKEELKYLKACGLDRYHHNLETSREFYSEISSYQKWEDRFKTVALAKEIGLEVCSGGIFGIGEKIEDIASLIESLKSLEVNSIPVNFLTPIRGTPLEKANFLTPLKALSILLAFRIALPHFSVRVCGGREYNLRELQGFSILIVDSLMVGNYLTTKGRSLKEDALLIKDLGLSSNLEV